MSISREIQTKEIKRNNCYNDVVNLLVYGGTGENKNLEKKIFNNIKDLIIFSAMVGKKMNIKEPVDSKNSTGINLGTFSGSGSGKGSRVDQHNIIFMFSLLHFKDMKYLRDGHIDETLKIFEEFSNGGLKTIKEWLIEKRWDSLCILTKLSDLMSESTKNALVIKDNPFADT